MSVLGSGDMWRGGVAKIGIFENLIFFVIFVIFRPSVLLNSGKQSSIFSADQR